MATTPAPRTSGAVADLVLKVTPPRVPRDLLVRPRLRSDAEQFRDAPAIAVQAPAGFGKTSLLAQWRREFLAHGAVVAWLSAQEQDDVRRFVQSLALAVRMGAGRPTFGHTLLEAAPSGLEGITAWLAELAQSALDVVLIVDTGERLPAEAREALAYVLHNAPPNLRIVVAARGDCDLGVDDLVTYGQCVALGTAALRFQLDETIALARARIGVNIDADTCARLHELTEGWPLGLQLALASISRGTDPRAAISAIAARGGELHDHLVGVLLANLEPADAAFLTRIALVDEVHPDLCRAVTGAADAPERLARLARDTPLFAGVESSDWLRMHALARDVLRVRFESLGPEERARLHAHASEWLAGEGLLEDAARHALAAGQREAAFDLAERCLYEAMTTRGHVGTVLDWLGKLPAAEVDRRPRFLLAAAWALAVSERNKEAEQLVTRILEHAGDDPALRCECALILGGAAAFADDPDRFAQLHDPWAVDPPLTDPLLRYMHANRLAFRALIDGDPAQARRYQQQAPRGDFGNAFGFVARWGEFVTALSYFWEGQVLLTESLLRPALASAEADIGRRNPFVCTFAALLAAALWERDQPAEAVALLANRLDVLERGGFPEAVMLGYRTAARIAVAEGAEHRAHELLDGMYAVGVARNLPRLCIASLGDQVRMHARRFRPETCRSLCERIDAILARDDVPQGPLWRRSAELLRWVAHANAAIAAQEWRRALEPLTRAGSLAETLRLGRVRIEMMALRALALDRSGEKSIGLLQEAIDLARAYGLARLFADAHPALDDWARRALAEPAAGLPVRPVVVSKPAQHERAAPGPRATPSMALTPKEREVLELLARNLSNKEIALAMQIGEETIKWHLKNLFGKLDAGTRKQVVRRAQLLGLLEQPAA
ncbi:MAG TPA: LuxR C-terminal-related transcriptional regulator [Burkholderiaceae bacterium]|nr:LuxR C-terminal-related transcriptional regulator [Burkholderiaceae bacterium]